MKKIIVFLFFTFFLCSAQKKITIKGYFDEHLNGNIMLLRAYDDKYQDSQIKDSAEIKNGVYEIKNFEIIIRDYTRFSSLGESITGKK